MTPPQRRAAPGWAAAINRLQQDERAAAAAEARVGLRLLCRGLVQGVGFRPAACRLARELGLEGRLLNGPGAVQLELAGPRPSLELFVQRLPPSLKPPARLQELEMQWLADPLPPALAPGCGLILTAAPPRPLAEGWAAGSLVADLAPCPDCRAELADPRSRRHRYPFLSCSRCGPRYSIARAEPWCRAHTTLASFPLCPACRREFEDPADRRFHAETIACPACGPRLRLHWLATAAERRQPPSSVAVATPDMEPLAAAAALLRAGGILALQGVGGYQLLVDAGDAAAVARLRRRKRRPGKPFALLVADASWLASLVCLDAAERAALAHPAAPIVLLRRHPAAAAALPGVAPGSPSLGVMLPASPLHQLLVGAVGRPLVCTSGNRSGEPLCIDPLEAHACLSGIADAVLEHDRAIVQRLDDSLLQVIEGRPVLLRRARGFAPEVVPLAAQPPDPAGPLATAPAVRGLAARGRAASPLATTGVIGLGSDLKSAPALAIGDHCWLAPHLGDLAADRSLQRLERGLAEWLAAHGHAGLSLACDAHPGYLSHQLAAAISRAAAAGHVIRPHPPDHPSPADRPDHPDLTDLTDHLARRGQPDAAGQPAVPAEGASGDRADAVPCTSAAAAALPLWPVSHHLAHGLAVVAEHGLRPPLLLLAFDGLGYGPPPRPPAVPRPQWRGGEVLLLDVIDGGGWRAEPLARLRPFPLPGAERALREPRRCALGLLDRAGLQDHPGAWRLQRAFPAPDRSLLLQALAAGCQAPECSSVGRLFDAVASLLGLVQVLAFEGQAGLRLQAAAMRGLAQAGPVAAELLPLCPLPTGPDQLDWGPLLAELLAGVAAAADRRRLAARFHQGLAEGLAASLLRLLQTRGRHPGSVPVALSGGCFQNRLLLELTAAALRRRGLAVHWNEAVPGNDGGLALGQILAVRQRVVEVEVPCP
jgi:hydrogenase maturation protein HypF